MHALLDHLERAGYAGSPRAVSAGVEDVVTDIPGESAHPHAWSDEGVFQVGALLRGLHDATAGFVPPSGATWHPWPFASDAPDATISHRDAGPWNIVARDGLPAAFIDWVTAGPADPLEEIAATAWLNAQLHDDDVAELQGLPSARARAAQLRHFADGYRLPAAGRQPLVTAMIEYAIKGQRGRGRPGRRHAARRRLRRAVGHHLARAVSCLDDPAPQPAGKCPDLNISYRQDTERGPQLTRNPRRSGDTKRSRGDLGLPVRAGLDAPDPPY